MADAQLGIRRPGFQVDISIAVLESRRVSPRHRKQAGANSDRSGDRHVVRPSDRRILLTTLSTLV